MLKWRVKSENILFLCFLLFLFLFQIFYVKIGNIKNRIIPLLFYAFSLTGNII